MKNPVPMKPASATVITAWNILHKEEDDMNGISSTIDLLTKSTEKYTATAGISDGIIDSSSSKVTGDRTTSLFSDAANKLGKDDFLMLLVTQLQYQDPLSPMENTEFISQLAQFSALENSTNVEKAITDLGDSFKSTVEAQQYSAQSMNNTAAVSLIGKDVRLRQTEFTRYASAGKTETLNIHLGNNNSALVEIIDSKGEVVRTLEASGKDNENSVSLTWDGTTDMETIAPSGTYTIRIQDEDKYPELYAFKQDIVEGIRFSSSGALIKIAGQEISVANVLDVSGSGTLNGGSNGLSSSTAVALLGKQVRTKVSTIQFNQATSERKIIDIAGGNRSSVQMELIDFAGNSVYTASAPVNDKGVAQFEWNGQQADGTYVENGEYQIRINGESTDQSLYAFKEGIVNGITNLNGDTRLRIGSTLVSMSSIIDITDVEA
jgi:flagellar basal-body rod modification protein FlgD